MDGAKVVILTRAAEHALAVLVGALSIYLGYRLFSTIPASLTTSGELKAIIGNTSIYLSQVAPGTLFALFGAGLIGYAVTRPIEYGDDKGEVHIRGMMDAVPAAAAQAYPHQSVVPVESVVKVLAEIADELRTTNKVEPRKENALREARVALMHSAWKAEWGPRNIFDIWVHEEAEQNAPAADIASAVSVYRGNR